MRAIFRDLDLLGRRDKGELTEVVNRQSQCNFRDNRGKLCVWSREASWCAHDGSEVARVHYYLADDGSLGASGLPDPKRIQPDPSRIYRLVKTKHGDKQPCAICSGRQTEDDSV